MRLKGKKIVLGVTGSIAAYKAVLLLRLLQQEGAEIKVIMTEGATRFVTPLTFSTLAQHPVFLDLWDDTLPWSQHVQLANWADLLIVAPCTANTLFKLAHGACDDALTAVVMAAACPIMVAPAMDREMYTHPATQVNLARIREFNYTLLAPDSGYLASGLEGQGRLAEPETIAERIISHFSSTAAVQNHSPLTGRRILISAGPTQEALDPVRYLSNHSSGKMGLALTQAALDAGAIVTLVLGPITLPVPHHPNLEIVPVVSALEMHQAIISRQARQEIIIMAAAVADFSPSITATQKIKKKPGETHYVLELAETPDILKDLGKTKPAGQLLVGFALETNDELANAKKKLASKKVDLLILNSQADPEAGFGKDTNRITVLDADGAVRPYTAKAKTEVAKDILQEIVVKLQHV